MTAPSFEERYAEVERVEQRTGLPKGYFLNLLHSDNWSFVIKLHALMEASLSVLLRDALGRVELDAWLSSLPMHGPAGKVELAESLRLLDREHARFLQRLSQLRNRFAHDPRSVGTTLDAEFQREDKNQRKATIDALTFIVTKELRAKFFDESPALAIWSSALFLLSMFSVQHDVFESNQRMRKLQEESAEIMSRAVFVVTEKKMLATEGPKGVEGTEASSP